MDPVVLLRTLREAKNGNFRVRLPLEWTGVAGEIAGTFNDIVDANERMVGSFQSVAVLVGTDGKISKRVSLGNAVGGWAAAMDACNELITDLSQPTSDVARVIGAVAKGDLTQRMGLDVEGRPLRGEFLRTARTINAMVDQLASFSSEVTRVARDVGTHGKLGGQAEVKGVAGTWKDLTDNVNSMAANLTTQVRNVAEVTTAVASGDLSRKITVDAQGEMLELKNTINTMVDQLGSFASEVTRVAREVGTEGKLGGQAHVRGVAGTWKDLTDNVNFMAANLTSQVRNIAEVTTAVANGDLSKTITVDVKGEMKGEILELKNTINTMVDQLGSFASEVTRVAREVGTEGKLGGQAQVKGVAGTWKDLTDNVNFMAANLTSQVRDIVYVTTAVANGDLSKKMTVEVRGEVLELKNTMNTMVDQLGSFASEVTRVAREQGTEGKLGGQAQVQGVAGMWKDLTDNVNFMAANLTSQVRNIAYVTTAVANGDLSKKITVDVRGEFLELKSTVNSMVDQLNSFASEVTRVAREVGTEGKLGGQARVTWVAGVDGTWKDLTDSVNSMAANLTSQVRNIAEVTTGVANGDLSRKITVDSKGEFLELKNTVNTMVDQLNSFASEVTRVAREVGTEGKLGGQAEVTWVAGTWKDLTDNVNSMAANLTSQVRNIAAVTTAVATGDLSRKITVDVQGEFLELKDTVNTMVDQLNSLASEVTRVAREVGTEGKLGGQAHVKGAVGTWKDLTDNVNFMAANLTSQVRNIADVTTAVAKGNLSRKITVDVQGEFLELKNTVNTMVDQLNSFASEVTRVAREVGTEGKLGGQAQVEGAAGTWKDLTDNVNSMADNLTTQVRGIARVVTAVANGDLRLKLTGEAKAKGEIAELSDTINAMIDTLAVLADQVTTVAREVGIDGKLGGQANVPGAAGLWRDLKDNVNGLAANLSTQVRAIAEVAKAVTKGDLTRMITVPARGEVESLKVNLNEMIRNLKETTQQNTEQDWLKTNLAKFTRLLQGERDLNRVARLLLSELAPVVSAQHGVFYISDSTNEQPAYQLLATYAYTKRKSLSNRFLPGEGLVGQCALEKERILITDVPPDYVQVSSGLGASAPANLVVLPVIFEGKVMAVVELASFSRFSDIHQTFLDQLTENLGIVLNTLAANMRTEELLKQSQTLTLTLQTQQDELRQTNEQLEEQAGTLRLSEEKLRSQQEKLVQTNEQLEEKAHLLSEQKTEVELKNREVELAKLGLEEKADQLSLTSRYKSEFLANMSHELRTPLNSLLIFAKLLADNNEANLSARQIEFARSIHGAGSDLLTLINDILDLSKIESGMMSLDISQLLFADLKDYVDRTFRHVALQKKLGFEMVFSESLPDGIQTDTTRLQQVLKNLLSNAFKFTDAGRVVLNVHIATSGWTHDNEVLNQASRVIAFAVSDSGIGIRDDKLQLIFEAFQQADMTTSRKYGGTGLGLSISREIARLLHGEITVESTPDEGSVFTFFLAEEGAIAIEPTPRLPAPARPGVVRGAAPALVLLAPPVRAEARPGPKSTRTKVTLDHPTPPPEERLETSAQIEDDRASIEPTDRVLLVIEPDSVLATQLVELGRANGFKVLRASRGAAALAQARRNRPVAVVMNIHLPDADGWNVLDRLKHDPLTRHVPVQVLSVEDVGGRALKVGAFSFLRLPCGATELEGTIATMCASLNRPMKQLLIVEDDDIQRAALVALLAGADIGCVAVATGTEALAALVAGPFDCVVLDLGLPDVPGTELLARIKGDLGLHQLPVILYTGREPTAKQERTLRGLVSSIVVKGLSSPERLLSEVSLILHRASASAPEALQGIVQKADPFLAGRKVLLADDDPRNLYALTSVLEREEMIVVHATNGREAIELLEQTPDVEVVLMDIMMPEMDGYEAMRRIRAEPAYALLPIIALTAKAMKGDREKCLEVGASEYIPKPVDTDQLLSVLRVSMYR
ncbi:MAG: HAMP domain-containing protein [Pseudomonadota bacterium]|nr:HAMP domain-containing protein [Pseudomonadota bacterium]